MIEYLPQTIGRACCSNSWWVQMFFKSQTALLSVAKPASTPSVPRILLVALWFVCLFNIGGFSTIILIVQVMALNINNDNVSFVFQSGFAMSPRYDYLLTAPDNNPSSQSIQLNGRVALILEVCWLLF